MSNTPPITTFFLEDEYWDQLNTENPLGMKGEIAKAYGDLAKIMWSGKYTCTAPRHFKVIIKGRVLLYMNVKDSLKYS